MVPSPKSPRACLRAVFIPLAALVALGAPSSTLRAQDLKAHDPNLLEKLLDGEYEGIGDSQVAVMEVMIIQMALGMSGCFENSARDPTASPAERFSLSAAAIGVSEVDLSSALMALAARYPLVVISVPAGALRHEHFHRTIEWARAKGCTSPPVTQALINTYRYLVWLDGGNIPVEVETDSSEGRNAPPSQPQSADDWYALWYWRCFSEDGGDMTRPVTNTWCQCRAGTVMYDWAVLSEDERRALGSDFHGNLPRIRRDHEIVDQHLQRCESGSQR